MNFLYGLVIVMLNVHASEGSRGAYLPYRSKLLLNPQLEVLTAE